MIYRRSYHPSQRAGLPIPRELNCIREKILVSESKLRNKDYTNKRYEYKAMLIHEHNKMLLNVIEKKIERACGRVPSPIGVKYWKFKKEMVEEE